MPDVSKPKLSEIRAWHRTSLGVDNDGVAALAAIDAVLALHVANDAWCEGCDRFIPCPTVRALAEHIDLEG